MEIYSFQSSITILLNILYALGAIVFASVACFLLKLFINETKAYHKIQKKLPLALSLFLTLILAALLIGSIFFSASFINSITFNRNMKNNNASFLEGDVVLVSKEENYSKDGVFMGYNVILKVEENILEPSNTLPKEVIEYFESDEKLLIQYGEIKNGGIYIWSIKTIKD